MPTGKYWFHQAAHEFGGVDPKDEAAVLRFFEEAYKTQPSEKQAAIIDYLMGHETAPAPDGWEDQVISAEALTERVPLPKLDESNPPADDPYWASLRGKTIVGGVVHDARGIPEADAPPPEDDEARRPPLIRR